MYDFLMTILWVNIALIFLSPFIAASYGWQWINFRTALLTAIFWPFVTFFVAFQELRRYYQK